MLHVHVNIALSNINSSVEIMQWTRLNKQKNGHTVQNHLSYIIKILTCIFQHVNAYKTHFKFKSSK